MALNISDLNAVTELNDTDILHLRTVAGFDRKISGSNFKSIIIDLINALDSFVPAGTVLPFGGSSAPDGFLLCNGAAVSRTTYAALFAVIGESFGVGDGSTTFNLPDLRGMFLRGAGTYGGTTKKANGNDYEGPAVGALQEDRMQGHKHELDVQDSATFSGGGTYKWLSAGATTFDTDVPKTDSVNGTPRTGDETRPVSIGVNHIIKI